MASLLRPGMCVLCALILVCGALYPLRVNGVVRAAPSVRAEKSMTQAVAADRVAAQRRRALASVSASTSTPASASASASASAQYFLASGASAVRRARAAQLPVKLASMHARHGQSGAPSGADLAADIPSEHDQTSAMAGASERDLSLSAAQSQIAGVAIGRRLPFATVRDLVAANAQTPAPGLSGEARVNLLALNLALDMLAANAP